MCQWLTKWKFYLQKSCICKECETINCFKIKKLMTSATKNICRQCGTINCSKLVEILWPVLKRIQRKNFKKHFLVLSKMQINIRKQYLLIRKVKKSWKKRSKTFSSVFHLFINFLWVFFFYLHVKNIFIFSISFNILYIDVSKFHHMNDNHFQ